MRYKECERCLPLKSNIGNSRVVAPIQSTTPAPQSLRAMQLRALLCAISAAWLPSCATTAEHQNKSRPVAVALLDARYTGCSAVSHQRGRQRQPARGRPRVAEYNTGVPVSWPFLAMRHRPVPKVALATSAHVPRQISTRISQARPRVCAEFSPA